jgi:hypothetical protein
MKTEKDSARSLSVAAGSAPFCAWCKKPMRHNVPRLGATGGWVHAENGSLTCANVDLVRLVPAGRADRDPKTIARDEKSVVHLLGVIAKLETPMLQNTRAAVLACLEELHARLSSPNAEISNSDPSK